ncbi:hypothetical protein [Allokutzneria oryzae]|uniref:Uncharacterized protein n=1 Tax=Allokutzneria oryzae TaxID=1378989 RepID=A0ABV6A9G7_9PSEU
MAAPTRVPFEVSVTGEFGVQPCPVAESGSPGRMVGRSRSRLPSEGEVGGGGEVGVVVVVGGGGVSTVDGGGGTSVTGVLGSGSGGRREVTGGGGVVGGIVVFGGGADVVVGVPITVKMALAVSFWLVQVPVTTWPPGLASAGTVAFTWPLAGGAVVEVRGAPSHANVRTRQVGNPDQAMVKPLPALPELGFRATAGCGCAVVVGVVGVTITRAAARAAVSCMGTPVALSREDLGAL